MKDSERALLSIIIPVFNEAHSIRTTLDAVKKIRGDVELIVVDGGSHDGTIEILNECGANVIEGERGRGVQMHAGASKARGDVLWFLHADTIPPIDAAEKITEALKDKETVGGNFHIRFDGDTRPARFLTWLYPKLRKIGLLYGDSGIFVRRDVYKQIGGFKPFPIFEDLDLVRKVKRTGRMIYLSSAVTTSSRRFEGRSFTLVFARWALLQLLYWLGANPYRLGKSYAPIRERMREKKERMRDEG